MYTVYNGVIKLKGNMKQQGKVDGTAEIDVEEKTAHTKGV